MNNVYVNPIMKKYLSFSYIVLSTDLIINFIDIYSSPTLPIKNISYSIILIMRKQLKHLS